MRVFVRVVEAGSFTRAADSLAIPKGTVTKQIQALESRLRAKLLNRTTRRVTVTPDGAAYYERAARLLNDFDELEAGMVNATASPTGRLRVDVGSATARLVIIPALGEFYEKYPDIRLDLGVGDRPVDLIGENVDVVIRGGTITEQSLVARRIGTLPLVTVASPGYIRKYGRPEHPLDLQRGRHHVLNHFSSTSQRMYPLEFRKDGEFIEISEPYLLAVNEANAHTTAALHGFGVTQMVSFIADPYIRGGALVPLLQDWDSEPLPMYVVYPPNRHLSAKVRAFVDWTASVFARQPQLARTPESAASVEAMSVIASAANPAPNGAGVANGIGYGGEDMPAMPWDAEALPRQ